jgi:GAF domain-containing protein
LPDVLKVEPARGIAAAPSHAHAGSEREALLRVAAAAAGAHDLEEVLEVAADEARTAIGAASLSVSRWEPELRALRTIINVGELGPDEERYPASEIHPLSEDRNAERLILEGRCYFNSVDAPELDEVSTRRLMRLGKESEVGVPILVEGQSWGEVYATTAPGQPRFRGDDVRFLETVAGQLAVAIGRAELFSRVSRLAYEDPLTGLANRRALEERLQRAVARSAERGVPLAVMLCDVDELKAINDDAANVRACLSSSHTWLRPSQLPRYTRRKWRALIWLCQRPKSHCSRSARRHRWPSWMSNQRCSSGSPWRSAYP